MTVREIVTVLGQATENTSCRVCGCSATVHPVNRLTAEGVTTRPPIVICSNPDCVIALR